MNENKDHMALNELRSFIHSEVHKILEQEKEKMYEEWKRRFMHEVQTHVGASSWPQHEKK